MTAIPQDARVSELREMFRFLRHFRMLHETEGLDEFLSSYGNTWSLWDLEYLYKQTERLNLPQRRAITLFLVYGLLEREAAQVMGVGINNPVGMYASLGLKRLLDIIDRGELDRYNRSRHPRVLAAEATRQLHGIAASIKDRVEIIDGHWLLPCRTDGAPTVLVRSVASSNGFLNLDARTVLYESERKALPHDCCLAHLDDEFGPAPRCVKPTHSVAVLTEQAQVRLRRAQARARSRRSVTA